MITTLDAAVGARVRARRLAMEMSLKEVAAVVGIHFTTLGKLETGKMRYTPTILDKIASALEADFSWLATGVDEPDVSYINVFKNENLAKDNILWPLGGQPVLFKIPVPEIDNDYACYGLRIDSGADATDAALGPWIVVIDPMETEIHSGMMYAAIPEAGTAAQILVPQSSPAGTYIWPNGELRPFGDVRYTVLGKVIYQARNLGIQLAPASEDQATADG